MRFLKTTLVLLVLIGFARTASAQFPTPTKEHELFQLEVGEWDADVTMFMGPAGPYDPPQKSKAKETNRMIGGFWLVSDFEGEFEGIELKGHGQFGYNARKKKYFGTWVDSFTPEITDMVGTYDEKTKTLTYETTGVGMGGEPSKGKNVVVYGEDKRVMSMYFAAPGTDEMIKVMEVVYTKVK